MIIKIKLRAIGVAALFAVTGMTAAAVVLPSANATSGPDHKQSICHPTGKGYVLIPPDKASSHIDESLYPNGHYWKHEHDGRHDVFAVDGVCPGTPTPSTTTGGTPSTSKTHTSHPTGTRTSHPTKTTKPCPSTSTSSTTSHPTTRTTTTSATSSVTTTTTSSTSSSSTSSSSTATKSVTSSSSSTGVVKPSRTASLTARHLTTSPSSSPVTLALTHQTPATDTLAFTGSETAKLIILAILFFVLGYVVHHLRRSGKH